LLRAHVGTPQASLTEGKSDAHDVVATIAKRQRIAKHLREKVLFNRAVKHFEVELTKQLLAPQFRAEILNYFRLPEALAVFNADPQFAQTRFMLGRHGPQERAL
jgi:hypothetical protein